MAQTQSEAARRMRIGVQPGHDTKRTLKDGSVKNGRTLDRVYFLNDDGTKKVPRDCATLARRFREQADDAVALYEDHGMAAMCNAYAEHNAGAVLEAARLGKNVMRQRQESAPQRLTDTFEYEAAV